MKNHCFLRNPKIFLCLLIMFVSGGAHGQTNSLHELMEYLKPDTSIIRNYKDGVSIMYSRSPIYGKRFHYVKIQSSHEKRNNSFVICHSEWMGDGAGACSSARYDILPRSDISLSTYLVWAIRHCQLHSSRAVYGLS